MAQISDRGQPFHLAAFHRLKLDVDAAQRRQLATPFVAREDEVSLPVAPFPAQAARLAGCGRGTQKVRFQMLALVLKTLTPFRDRQGSPAPQPVQLHQHRDGEDRDRPQQEKECNEYPGQQPVASHAPPPRSPSSRSSCRPRVAVRARQIATAWLFAVLGLSPYVLLQPASPILLRPPSFLLGISDPDRQQRYSDHRLRRTQEPSPRERAQP